ncbi:MAG TPA: choice-of-anchor Q domain-containing protein, partial [Puia sp.]|nr:choice-of-anchor Q domain-containing protein [Puia sp.]
SVSFTNCLWKVKTAPANVTVAGMIANMDPLFDSVNNSRAFYDFHLKAGSPAIDKGVATSLLVDLDGNPRVVGLPDLGSYERQ